MHGRHITINQDMKMYACILQPGAKVTYTIPGWLCTLLSILSFVLSHHERSSMIGSLTLMPSMNE
jgi:hypothetical protein